MLRYALVFAVAGLTTWFLTPLVLRLCWRYGWFDHPNGRKVHQNPVPRLGGVAIFFGFWLAVAVGLARSPDRFYLATEQFAPIFFGSLVILAIGLYDDLKGAVPAAKLLAQITAGLILIAWGIQIRVLYIPFVGGVALGATSVPVTLLWLLALANTINLIDGLDGLAAGISAIVAASLLLTGLFLKIESVAIISAAVMGATLAFLRFNWHPARLFMGDSGSLVLGFLFASVSIICPVKSITGVALFVPLLALGVPLIETASAIVRRISAKQKLLAADNQHLFHYLLGLGLSQRAVVWLFYVAACACLFVVLCLLTLDRRVIVSALMVLYVMLFLALAFALRQLTGRSEKGVLNAPPEKV